MKHLFRILTAGILLFWLGAPTAAAQSPAGYGDWQLHLPANRPLALADASDRLYVATEASLFYVDKKLNTTQLLSRRDGLNDVGVAALDYDSVSRRAVLAYRNGNLDVIDAEGRVRNIPDVVRKNVQGSKTIFQVQVAGPLAFVSTSFGLLRVDLDRLEVRDTYSNIGVGGRPVAVFAAAVWRDTLYAATADGLLRGPLQANLLDYRNWTREPNPTAETVFRFVAVYQSYVYAAVNNNGGLYRLSGVGTQRQWRQLPNTVSPQWRQLRATAKGLFTLNDADGLRRLDPATGRLVPLVAGREAAQALDVAPQADGSYFLASIDNGLLRLRPGSAPERFVPNGPLTSRAFNILADARTNTIDVFSGGFADRYDQQGQRDGFYEYQGGQWTNFASQTLPAADYPNLLDLSRGTRTPDGTLYAASYGNGLLEWQGVGKFRQFTQGTPGSPLLSALPNEPDYTRVTDVAADADGNVWVVNRHGRVGRSGLFLFKPVTSEWETVPFFPGSNNLDRVLVDDNGTVWVSEARKDGAGLWAIDRAGALPRHFIFTDEDGLPSNELYDLVKDRRGFIWAATSTGVAVSDDPVSVFEPGNTFQFRPPFVQRGEGKGYNALYSDIVRCAAVDGGNRKWFGTDNGLWLFSEDADEALLHFTTANSPLPSNRIVDVAVNDKTGEVFVATEAGVVSYRGAASITEGKPSCAQAFPNPVRPDFGGQVGISGLANNAVVKITDVAGRLVYSTRANGGTVTWNLNDATGRRVRSGVYLVLSSDADGKNGCVSKVAVL
ncbi:T9SS type A sorting domain-containing protein [uncultured Hymenobacter sp.]|uniref:type IX secretion system anionic LPS delivery protein PorZ n=1 Tax=uncultured Hymenobacter sp. TaxID=170016 RepID=UPI0035CA72B4